MDDRDRQWLLERRFIRVVGEFEWGEARELLRESLELQRRIGRMPDEERSARLKGLFEELLDERRLEEAVEVCKEWIAVRERMAVAADAGNT